MVQKYQNEIAPIFYYRISTKTNEKDLKIPDLQALTIGRVKKITLYFLYKKSYFMATLTTSLVLSAYCISTNHQCIKFRFSACIF